MRFEEILTNEDVLDGLYDMHFDECTPIQEKAIPAILEGRDLLACAQTGTGKTATYLLPVINQLAENSYPKDSINCVIMAPTRELVQQIDRQLQGFAYFMPVSGIAIYGGTDGPTYEQQRKGLKAGVDIVIATPGRLIAHLNMGYVNLSNVDFFILDEADRMLDMGFYEDIMNIMSYLPKKRQTLMFSATMPPKIQLLSSKILNNPFEIKLSVDKPADKIKQSLYICYENQKLPILKDIFKSTRPERVIIFSSSKAKVKLLARELRNNKYVVAEMHSDLDQTTRDNVMFDFKAGKINVIIATDILSRGIDVEDIETVVNFDMPSDPEDYIHRIGRTARAQAEGTAVSFVTDNEFGKLARIEKLMKIKIPRGTVDSKYGTPPDESKKNFKSYKGRNNNNKRKNNRRKNNINGTNQYQNKRNNSDNSQQ